MGESFIRKLQGMFNDVQDESIIDINRKFEQYNQQINQKDQNSKNIDFEIQVIFFLSKKK